MSREIDEIYSRLLARDYALTLFGDLQKRKKAGRNYMALCPFHEDKTPSFSFSMDKPLFYCFGCNAKGDWIRYLEKKEGLPFQEALDRLAKEAGVETREYDRERWEKEAKKATAFETALYYFKDQLWTEKGKGALTYLKGRGYSEDEIKGMELGFYPSWKEFGEYIVTKGISIDFINSLGLKVKGMGDTHKVVISYRDPVGRLKGFIVRAVKEVEPKYLFTSGVEKDTLFNFHEARGRDTVIVVEGFLDALVSTQRGLEGVVALGGSSLSEAQLEDALRYGVKSFVLALDNDKVGQEGTERTLDLINGKELKAYVVTLPEGYKDPDELIKAKGIGTFKELVDKAESGAIWKAKRLLSKPRKQSLQTDRGRDEVIREALEWDASLPDARARDGEDFLKIIAEATGYDIHSLIAERRGIEEKKAQERLEKGYRDLLKKGSTLIEEGKITDLKELLDERIPELRAKAVTRVIEPYTHEKGIQELRKSLPGFKTNYPSLDKYITIPREAMTIIVSRPSHGKTTFLLNLFLNMIRAYPENAFFYFSYEQTAKQLWVRILTMLSRVVLDPYRNYIQMQNYLKGEGTTRKPKEEIEGGIKEFKDLVDKGRLWLLYEPFHVDELADTLTYLKGRYENIGAVFIDYLQKVKIKGRHPSRQVEIQKVSEGILESALTLSLPIILGAQFNREVRSIEEIDESKIREAGDIEQDANLILGLWNETENRQELIKKPIEDNPVDITVLILKNRDGIKNKTVDLSFDRPILTITDELTGKDPGRW